MSITSSMILNGIILFKKVTELWKWIGTRKSTRSIMGLGRVELNFFYKFQCELIFDPVHPDWICDE